MLNFSHEESKTREKHARILVNRKLTQSRQYNIREWYKMLTSAFVKFNAYFHYKRRYYDEFTTPFEVKK